MKTVTIDGKVYVEQVATGNRCIVVVDRGWIFAGDLSQKDGRIYLDRPIHVFKWQTGGLALVVSDPAKAQADLRPVAGRIDIPEGAEVFRIPVDQNWGVKCPC